MMKKDKFMTKDLKNNHIEEDTEIHTVPILHMMKMMMSLTISLSFHILFSGK